jgi:diguanylate cyclase (GGDEF)-like protein/PAS domain S-box-containing protein
VQSNFSPWHSLKVRVTAFTLAVFVLGLVALSIYATRLLRADLQRMLGDQQFQAVSVIAAQVNVELKDRQDWLAQVAGRIDSHMMGNPAALQAYLEQRMVMLQMFNGGAWVAGLDGIAMADVPRSAQRIGVNYLSVDFIAAVLKDGKAIISGPIMGKKLQKPVVAMAMPIRDAQGRVIGVISGVTDLARPNFLDKIAQGHYGKTGGYLLMAPQHKLIVTASDKTRIMQPVPAPGVNAMHDRYMQGYEGFGVAVSSRGVEELSAAKAIPVAGWFLAAVMPTSEAFAPIYAMQQRMLLATMALTLLIGFVTWWILKHQLTPLVVTADAMVALADKDQLAQPLAARRPDELGYLVGGFNRILQTWTQREAALQDSQQNLTITLNSIGDAVIATDTAGRVTRMNPTAERLTGWPLADALGQPLSEVFRIISALTRLPALNPVQMVMERGEVVGMANHTTLLACDGREYQIADSAAPIRNAVGDIVGVVLVFSDVSERYRVELALKESEQQYRSLLENLSVGVVVHRPDTTVVMANAMAAHLLGLTLDQMLGKAAFDPDWCFVREDGTTMPPEEYPVNLVLTAGEPLRNSVGGVRHPGRAEPTWVICNAYPTRDAEGNILQAVVTFADITQRKQAELALQRRKAMLERTENLTRVASFEWEVDANIVTWSPEMFRLFGRDPALGVPNLEGQAQLYTPESTQTLFDAVSKAVADGTPYTIELMTVQPDGEERPCIAKGFPERDAKGRVVRLVGLVQDITERKQAEVALLASEERWKFAIEGAGDGLWDWNVQTGEAYYSPRYKQMFGYADADFGSTSDEWSKRVHPDDAPGVMAALQPYMEGKPGSATVEFRMLCKDGSWMWTMGRGMVVQRDADGKPLRMIGTNSDITERMRAQEKLQLAAGVFTHALEGIVITAPDATIIDVNESFTRITGYSREEAVGQTPRILSSGRHDRNFYAAMWSALTEQGHWSGEVWNRRKRGEVFAELLTISAVRNAAGNTQHYVALFSDITLSKEHQNRLEHIAHFDALTNLPNRVLLADRLQQAMAQAQRRQQRVAVAYVDLDGFKAINDHHGHVTGDQVLITLAQRMKDALREGDTMARIGGDEFVAVLIDLEDTTASEPLLNRLLAAAALPVQVGNLMAQVSASVGVTFYPQAQDIDADQLLRQADQVMYQAKVTGKNRYCVFDAAQDSILRVHHESQERIRQALDCGEFVLHYQPKVNMHSGQVTGAEALIRWQHPEKGLLAPAAFLSVIEDDPLAVVVGEWVIDTALAQIEQWQAIGLELPVSVNIGARQLQQSSFFQRLQAILALHPQVNPAKLALEVLETSALADMVQVAQVIEDCAQIGVTFALDDFGTGYSSLTYLKRLQVTQLKIDQSFVRDMLDEPDDLAILQGVIGLACAFGREVIAEGVETVAHGTALLRMGCELAQGYGIARPMPPEQLPAWAASWRPDAAWCGAPMPGRPR